MPTKAIENALKVPNGARYYRCALQVNPFAYVQKYGKKTTYADEKSYNQALIAKCINKNIEVIAVTDHWNIDSSRSLIEEAKEAGIWVFPGFEAKTSEGVHFLCLFNHSVSLDFVRAKIHECGIYDGADDTGSKLSKFNCHELLNHCNEWDAQCIAAHVASEGGLLRVLQGEGRAAVWKNERLLACSLPGPIEDAPDNLKHILQNKDPNYQRKHPMAVINAQDISDPSDLDKPGTFCWIKMSEVSIEGLRQAFLDPESRIRLASEAHPEVGVKLIAMAWETEGFLKNCVIHFNENLNVLIGGRGAGKSTIIESLRYALQLEPIGDDAKKAHESIVRQVLKNGTKVSLLVKLHHPTERQYLIERTVPNPPVVKDEEGNVLEVIPRDILPGVEVYGQHEISEIARDASKQINLLQRFMATDSSFTERKKQIQQQLAKTRQHLLDIRNEIIQIDEKLAALPLIEETLKRYKEAGLEEKLKEKSMLVREEIVLKTTSERLKPFKDIAERLRSNLPVDRAFVSEKALEELPSKELLAEIDGILKSFNNNMASISTMLEKSISETENALANIIEKWEERRRSIEESYQRILRELQKQKVDGEEFVKLRRQLEELSPLKERRAALMRKEQTVIQYRRNLLDEWEEVKREEFQELERAAKRVGRELRDLVRVQVIFVANREPLYDMLRGIGGRMSEGIEALKKREELSVQDFVAACRSGEEEIKNKYGFPPSQAERLVKAGEEFFMKIEELDLLPGITLDLNIAPEGQAPDWRKLEDLSAGQKATAILLLLLLETDSPLVIDQPEDDLDNRFITEGIVPRIRQEKRSRQLIFSTHNANIPVLGDAELIVGLSTTAEAGHVYAQTPVEKMGSIDAKKVADLVKKQLEGGKAAFEERQRKYGF